MENEIFCPSSVESLIIALRVIHASLSTPRGEPFSIFFTVLRAKCVHEDKASHLERAHLHKGSTWPRLGPARDSKLVDSPAKMWPGCDTRLQLALHVEQPSAFDSMSPRCHWLLGEIKINKEWCSRKASGCLHYLAGGGREIYYSVRRPGVFPF